MSVDRKEFCNELAESIRKLGYEVTEIFCVKINGERDGLIFRNKSTFSPILYVETFYKEYLQGSPVKNIAERIVKYNLMLSVCEEKRLQEIPMFKHKCDYSGIRKNLRLCLINKNSNEKLLVETPHYDYGDFAGVIYWILEQGDRLLLRQDMFEKLQVDERTAFKDAYINMMGDFEIRSLEDMMYEKIASQLKKDITNDMPVSKYIKQLCQGTEMYVVTHRMGSFGAAAVCYDREIDRIADRIRGDFIMIPASIHELIFIPFHKNMSIEAVNELIKEVNQEVDIEDRLSDSAYVFKADTKKIVNTKEYAKNTQQGTVRTNEIHQHNEFLAREEWSDDRCHM